MERLVLDDANYRIILCIIESVSVSHRSLVPFQCQRKLRLLEGMASNGVRAENYSDEATGTDDAAAVEDNAADEMLTPLSPDASDTQLIAARNSL